MKQRFMPGLAAYDNHDAEGCLAGWPGPKRKVAPSWGVTGIPQTRSGSMDTLPRMVFFLATHQVSTLFSSVMNSERSPLLPTCRFCALLGIPHFRLHIELVIQTRDLEYDASTTSLCGFQQR